MFDVEDSRVCASLSIYQVFTFLQHVSNLTTMDESQTYFVGDFETIESDVVEIGPRGIQGFIEVSRKRNDGNWKHLENIS